MREKLALVFPGSGSQYSGMAVQQYNESSVIRRTFEEADDVLGYGISDIILNGNAIKLNRINNMFLAIYIVSVGYFRRYIEEICVRPAFMAGHSLGEYTALTCSGAMSFDNGLRIVKLRSRLAENVMKSVDASMTIIKNVSPQFVEILCEQARANGGIVSTACYNSPSQVSISGHDEVLRSIEQAVLKNNKDTQIINLLGSAPYHCELMKPCVSVLEEELRKYRFSMGKCQVISNVTGLPYTSVEEIIKLLSRQLYQPVKWQQTLQYLLNEKIKTMVEVGPQNVLKKIAIENSDRMKTYAYDEYLDRDNLKRTLLENPVAKNRLKAIAMCITQASSLKNCNTDPDYDNTKSRVLYEQTRAMKAKIENAEVTVCDEHVESAFGMLEAVFEEKQTPIRERESRLKMIIEKSNLDEA